MALSINRLTSVIFIPKADLSFISGTLYGLDTDAFRLELKGIEDSSEGMAFLRTHKHNTAVTVAGVTYARFVEIINGYSVEFEDGAYSVNLSGSNNNIFDIAAGILVQNQVQVIPNNSAGLIQVTSGSGVLPSDVTDIVNAVFAHIVEDTETFNQQLRLMRAEAAGKLGVSGTTVTIRDAADTKDRITATVDTGGQRTSVTTDAS